MEHILTTKLFIPPTRLKLVSRQHLVKRLNEGLHRKLSLISAPAGFGKTTLLSEWLEQIRGLTEKTDENGYRTAWLSLDENDNDLARFLSYFIASLNRVDGLEVTFGEGALKLLQSPQLPPIETILTSLINEIAEISVKIVSILDDYHLISSAQIDDALVYLLENLPPQLHLVIATRDDPQLPLARMRVSGQINEVRATDLRFTSSEAVEFLNQVMDLDLSAEDIEALESRTEGWIAGLQLAAISLRGQEDVRSFIETFTGSHRLVLDYLIEEVLEQQSENIQSFLLKTAVLNRLSGQLCDALTDKQDGQQVLESLEQANLFIIPLDNERRWYRYHHLFGDLLRSRLRQHQLEKIPGLHQKAGLWFEENGYIDEAVEHAMLAEDYERAAMLIEGNAGDWFQRGEHIRLERWLSALPERLLIPRPFLSLIHSAILVSSGQLEEGDRRLKVIEGKLEGKSDANDMETPQELGKLPEPERKMLTSFASLTRSYLKFYQGDLEETIRLANLVLESDSGIDAGWRSSAVLVLGDAYTAKGDMPSAYQMQAEALEMSKLDAEPYMILATSLKLATTLRMLGKLQEVQTICYQEINRAADHGLSKIIAAGGLLTIWGETLIEKNQLEEGYNKVKEGIGLAGSTTDVNMLGLSNLNYIRALFSRGDLAGALEVIQKLEKTNLETNIPSWIFNQINSWKARIWLTEGKLSSVSRWVDERWLDQNVLPLDCQEMEKIMIARFLQAAGRSDEATKLLEELLKLAEEGGRRSRVIEIMLLQALGLQAQGNTDQALSRLELTLTLAEPDYFIQAFVDEGPAMEVLLKKVKLDNERLKEYVQKLLIAFRVQESDLSSGSAQPLIEPLSERELDVLRLIAEGLTNQEIADRLFLSLHTIKVHAGNIYSKLGVHTRTHAGARARELGILDPE